MLPRHADPIAAIATAPGRGAVGIVRVSGRDLSEVISALCGKSLLPRMATYLPLLDAQRLPIDHGLAIHFPSPHSYTGEDVVELHAHGGAVVLQLLLARCLEAGVSMGLRVAEPGEFTKRAFLNDKLDLAQAEAVSDLIDASTEAAARSASRSLSGAFSAEIHTLRDGLIKLRMLVEATLDFPEEEIDFLQQADAAGQLDRLSAQLSRVMRQTRQGVLLREGIKVVIAGQPNVGKSSLLNALAGAELAIVTPIAGTTRDKVSQTIQIEGVPIHVVDTAGLRDTSDEIERIGIARTWDEIAGADALLFLHDLTRAGEAAFDAADAKIAARFPADLLTGDRLLHVFNKMDAAVRVAQPSEGVSISATTGEGLNALRHQLLQRAGWNAGAEGVFTARTRHVQALVRADAHLLSAVAQLQHTPAALDLLAEDLRLAQHALGEITGEFSADDLLGEIFSRFCIGK
ncbi:MAG: tRNA uridine-5-carboxymethylaminomethyl(34) synthesis GTPase MnmE [Pseudorhodobacter sp.]|nr:tRNA uridine-5-carboxymethylaminomethyl(34) synthesis GTPase MnmE [Rhizobacter sp.]